tara:strand:- start:829 stop:1848 length:1020 start_codon:yes stop_codon:yes gene_type:complete
MPLIDEENNHLDVELMSDVASVFSTKNGLIIDENGNQWYLWRIDGLDSWWRFFEEIIDAPMGRKLANAACDEEEFLLGNIELNFNGFFRKKKTKAALNARWKLHGWGAPYIYPPSFESIGLTPVFSGILQAQLEKINSSRYRMLWEEKSPQATILTLEPTSIPLTKSKSVLPLREKGKPLLVELESGWRIDGLGHLLLPVGMFKRLEMACSGLVGNIGEDERNSWPDFGDGFLSIAIACKRLFIAGEELFLAADIDGWVDSCETFFGSRGFSSPISGKVLDTPGGIELKFETIPCLAMTVGYLAGAWVRSEGRPVKISVNREDNFDIIKLESRHEISSV